MEQASALTDIEREELEDFLMSGVIAETSMDVAALEGYLTAIVIGPDEVGPEDWLPWVWDMFEGEVEPEFADEAEEDRILDLVVRLYNTLAAQFEQDPDAFDPVFWHGPQWGAGDWCEGFLTGTLFFEDAWQAYAHAEPDLFAPIFLLASEEPFPPEMPAEEVEQAAHELMEAIGPVVARMYAHWRGQD